MPAVACVLIAEVGFVWSNCWGRFGTILASWAWAMRGPGRPVPTLTSAAQGACQPGFDLSSRGVVLAKILHLYRAGRCAGCLLKC